MQANTPAASCCVDRLPDGGGPPGGDRGDDPAAVTAPGQPQVGCVRRALSDRDGQPTALQPLPGQRAAPANQRRGRRAVA